LSGYLLSLSSSCNFSTHSIFFTEIGPTFACDPK